MENTTPPKRAAIARAAVVLPAPVGPATRIQQALVIGIFELLASTVQRNKQVQRNKHFRTLQILSRFVALTDSCGEGFSDVVMAAP
jgi:hypothetical protein